MDNTQLTDTLYYTYTDYEGYWVAYDPLTSIFLSPDPYVQDPGNWLNYNRYGYCLNNPMLYTDPSGEFLGIFMRGLSFIGGSLSNLIHGYNDPFGSAWKSSGSLVNNMSNCLQFPIIKNENTLLTAGLDPFGLGVSANIVHRSGNATFSGSVGFGLMSGFSANLGGSYSAGNWDFSAGVGAGTNYWGWNAGLKVNGYGGSYGQTYYGNAIGPDGLSNAQTVGNVTAFWRGGSFRIENDLLGDGHDRWRSNAVEVTIGDFVFGTTLYNNDPATEGQGIDAPPGRPDLLGNYNKHEKSSWKNGQTYFSPFYVGVKSGGNVYRLALSAPIVQDRTQNWVHRNGFFYLPVGYQHFYTKYDNFKSGIFIYERKNQPFSLWGN